MTNEEAIKNLQCIRSIYGHLWVKYTCDYAIEELEKQIPKKPNGMKCTECGEEVFLEPIDHNTITYCWHCGQAHDWRCEE